jgi:hypothetical protein
MAERLRAFIFGVLCCFLFLFCGHTAYAQSEPLGWIEIKGDSVSVYYLPGANLRKIERRLRSRYLPVAPLYRDLFENKKYPIESRISARLQFILQRVEDILNMKPAGMKVRVNVYNLRRDMQVDQRELLAGREFRSFYVHDLRTVFTSEQDIIDSVIAHEFGHAVIDSYFAVPPPEKVAELLATFVDEHLERD